MKWVDLFDFLNKQANDIHNVGKFPWQDEVQVFDWETLEHYQAEFIQMPGDSRVFLAVDTYQQSETAT